VARRLDRAQTEGVKRMGVLFGDERTIREPESNFIVECPFVTSLLAGSQRP
jgi:hypothetical protein